MRMIDTAKWSSSFDLLRTTPKTFLLGVFKRDKILGTSHEDELDNHSIAGKPGGYHNGLAVVVLFTNVGSWSLEQELCPRA